MVWQSIWGISVMNKVFSLSFNGSVHVQWCLFSQPYTSCILGVLERLWTLSRVWSIFYGPDARLDRKAYKEVTKNISRRRQTPSITATKQTWASKGTGQSTNSREDPCLVCCVYDWGTNVIWLKLECWGLSMVLCVRLRWCKFAWLKSKVR